MSAPVRGSGKGLTHEIYELEWRLVTQTKRDLRRLTTLALSLVLFGVPVLADVIAPVPGNFVLDGKIGEWDGIPPSQQIRYSGDTTESDSFWLGRSRRGLVVAGSIRNNRWKFATRASELANQGRLEIWLSTVESFDLPEIKYNQEGVRRSGET